MSSSNTINLLHWNPHYECFIKNCCVAADSCPAAVIGRINLLLSQESIDFASLVMFETKTYQPPKPYREINAYPSGQCGMDSTSILYNSAKWVPDEHMFYVCLKPKDRMTIIQKFKSVTNPAFSVWVVAAHFGHDQHGQFDPPELNFLHEYLYVNPDGPQIGKGDNLVFMADTNAGSATGNQSNQYILQTILGGPRRVVGSEPFQTCCYNDQKDGQWSPFQFSSDRIIANFGNRMETVRTGSSDPGLSAQEWAKSVNIPDACYKGSCKGSPIIGEMHKYVVAKLHIDTFSTRPKPKSDLQQVMKWNAHKHSRQNYTNI